jgi:hypothetical protein
MGRNFERQSHVSSMHFQRGDCSRRRCHFNERAARAAGAQALSAPASAQSAWIVRDFFSRQAVSQNATLSAKAHVIAAIST